MKKINFLITVLSIVALATTSSCINHDDNNNVVYLPAKTIFVNLPANAWTKLNGGTDYTTSINVPELTSQLNTSGAVLVYISFGNSEYEAIPEVFDRVSYSFTHQPGVLNIDIQSVFDEVLLAPAFTAKIVLIEGQQVALHPGANLRNYNEVMKTFKPVEKTIIF